ncbi:MAG: hypothetical protein A2846_04780 [Candidatus Doudnabacteria bacterium RIFCSPHIGHO2_01_FULL_49_9]|uniref:Uncharacterized protein n=1 Tax=Candidatus Doudnabacteria bacterium RIFCSPHIGHO2_01_FULL_49_9 TaxID=1817827 RepID=A0A1F5P1P4_9BACT|nr:MAG: hypothetical protein A2846_04780 [Candidatus Doudnabacteria bacterium RIFCSPHIGHO2_01_FULL_49_9]
MKVKIRGIFSENVEKNEFVITVARQLGICGGVRAPVVAEVHHKACPDVILAREKTDDIVLCDYRRNTIAEGFVFEYCGDKPNEIVTAADAEERWNELKNETCEKALETAKSNLAKLIAG